MANKRVGGVVELKIDGNQYRVKGNFTYGLGKNQREAIVGHDGVHGYKELPTVPFIEGEITDAPELSLDRLANVTDATVTLSLANGKVIALREAWFTNPDGLTAQTEEGVITFRMEGLQAEEIR